MKGDEIFEKSDKYGKLTFAENIQMDINGKMYSTGLGKFICECGNEYIGNILNVRNGNTKSCGCLLEEKSLKAARCKYKIWDEYRENKIKYTYKKK